MNKMFNYPIEKYKFYSTTNKVVAVSTYQGRTVRGVATCDPKDTFDIEKGKMLAAARCNQKIAMKRRDRADRELRKAVAAYDKAQKHMYKMNDYYEDSRQAVKNATSTVDQLLADM